MSNNENNDIVIGIPQPAPSQEIEKSKVFIGLPLSNSNYVSSNNNNMYQSENSDDFTVESYHTQICCFRCGITIFTLSILTCAILLLLNLTNINPKKNSIIHFLIFLILVLSILVSIVLCIKHDKLQSIGIREYVRRQTDFSTNHDSW